MTKTKEDIANYTKEASKTLDLLKKMTDAEKKFMAISAQKNNPNYFKTEVEYKNAKSAFENSGKGTINYIEPYEIKKTDFILV